METEVGEIKKHGERRGERIKESLNYLLNSGTKVLMKEILKNYRPTPW